MAARFNAEVKGVKKVVSNLKLIRPEAFKQLRRDMRTDIAPVVAQIKSVIPPVSPLSGFNHANRRPKFPGYNSSNPSAIGISTPTTMRGKNAASILTLSVTSAAVSILDQAGQRSDNPLARALQKKRVGRNRRAGLAQRFAWPALMMNLPLVNAAIAKILDKVAAQATARIKAGI